jgi:hypothetical protein
VFNVLLRRRDDDDDDDEEDVDRLAGLGRPFVDWEYYE